MVAKHRNHGLIAILVFWGSAIAAAGAAEFWPIAVWPVLGFSMASFSFAFWAFAKAKGYSGFYGLLLSLLSLVGLIILVKLPDKNRRKASDSEVGAQQAAEVRRP